MKETGTEAKKRWDARGAAAEKPSSYQQEKPSFQIPHGGETFISQNLSFGMLTSLGIFH